MSVYFYVILLAAGLTLIVASAAYGWPGSGTDKPASRYLRAALMAGVGVLCCAVSTLLTVTIGVTL